MSVLIGIGPFFVVSSLWTLCVYYFHSTLLLNSQISQYLNPNPLFFFSTVEVGSKVAFVNAF